jgi:ATP-binding cassette subfamily F protein uup
LVFEADGSITKHAGGYSDWARRDRELAVADEPKSKTRSGARARDKPAAAPRKLSYMLQRELDALPARIERLEIEVAALREAISSTEFYRRPHAEVHSTLAELKDTEQRLEAEVERWAELEQQAQSSAQSRDSESSSP